MNEYNTRTCQYCGRHKSKKGNPFTSKTLKQHIRDCHTQYKEPEDGILDLVDMIAGDESDGVYWGIAYEMGYFG